MTTISVRQSGGANIVSIPRAIINTLGLDVGSKLDLSIDDNRIVLTPLKKETLDDLLAGSPKECFRVTQEDSEWINDNPLGKEI